MLRFAYFAIFLTVICVNLVNCNENISHDSVVITVNNVTTYLRENPHVELREFDVNEISDARSMTQRHTLGIRIHGNWKKNVHQST